MKTLKHYRFYIIITILILAMIACSSSSNIKVNPPDEEVVEESPVEPDDALENDEGITSVEEEQESTDIGTSRSNPAPVGSEVVIDQMAFVVLGLIRPADDKIMEGNQFNTEPEPGQEYILLKLEIKCLKSSDDQCSFSPLLDEVKVIGSSGIGHDSEWFISGVDGLLEDTEFFGGTIISGSIPFIIGQEETDLVFVYEPFLGDTFYLAIPSEEGDIGRTEPVEDSAPLSEDTEEKEVGTARSNPAPVGSEVIADDMAFIVTGAIRPATNFIMDGNMFNSEPEPGQEYIMVELSVTCMKSIDESCTISPFWNISLIGSAGIKYDAESFVAGVDGLLESTEFYGEATVSGYLPFIVNEGETNLILVYEPMIYGDTFYLEIPTN